MVIAGIGLLQLGLDLLEFVQLVVGDVDRGPRGQLAADVSLHVGDVGDVAPGYRQHHETAAGLLGDQALGAQGEQRLTHRCDTDSQFRGQLVQANVGTRGVAAIEYPVADQAARHRRKVAAAQRNPGQSSPHT